MRTIVQQQLELAAPADLPPEQIVQGSALGRQLPFPFCVHRYRDQPATSSGGTIRALEVWVYDQPGDYGRIDRLLALVKARLVDVFDIITPDRSERIATVDFLGYSPDLPAEEFQGICRSATFNLVGRSG